MRKKVITAWLALAPGLLLCGAVSAVAGLLEHLETRLFGRAWLESLVLAILLGSALRTAGRLPARCEQGIQLGAKTLLEWAVVLLGASVSAGAVWAGGAAMVGGIAVVVLIAIVASYAIGRLGGLPREMALLIACGNSICGNSAIAAVAPVIAADGEDVTAAIAFTAVLGVVVVLTLPLLMPLLTLSPRQYGIFAGMTVYAVPQVLAATSSVSLTSVHIGTLVKLMRVLMLGPVVLILSLLNRRRGDARPPLAQMLPWFIGGFLLLMALRSADLLPPAAQAAAHLGASALTVMSMAALGLGVDARAVLRAGPRVAGVVVLSLLVLSVISVGFVKLLRVD